MPDYNSLNRSFNYHQEQQVNTLHKRIKQAGINYHEVNRQLGIVLASYYGHGEKLNRHTSSGAVFNPNRMTAAHRTLPLGSHLLVEYNGKQVVVEVNDRGPALWTGRSLDLSYGAAKALGMTARGTANVKISLL